MADFEKTIQFYNLVTVNKRITIRQIADRMSCSERTVYRMVSAATRHIPIRLEQGVVIREDAGSCLP